MKTYKRSIWSSVTIWACFIPILTFACIIPLTILYVPEKSSLLLIPFIPLIILLAASASALFYIELTENELILKNAVCRFWHKAYPYQTITRINTVRFSLSHSSKLRTERRMISDGGRCRCEGAAPGSRTARMSSFTASVPISSVGWPMQVIAGSR